MRSIILDYAAVDNDIQYSFLKTTRLVGRVDYAGMAWYGMHDHKRGKTL